VALRVSLSKCDICGDEGVDGVEDAAILQKAVYVYVTQKNIRKIKVVLKNS
jgi:hypothetical protein